MLPAGGWAQDFVAVVVGGAFAERQDLDDDVGQADHLAALVEAVVVADRTAPGDLVETVAEAVGVLVVAGLFEALRGDVDVVVGRADVPGESGRSRIPRGS